MADKADPISVNGICIAPTDIHAELQYHPAPSLAEARMQAIKAIVIRELLLQRAAEMGLCTLRDAVKNPDPVIDALLEAEIALPEADDTTCRRYYDNNRGKFVTSPLFEVSHILYPAAPQDAVARLHAKEKAEKTLAVLKMQPERFDEFAKAESACSSSVQGGSLGQISKGQTMPAFEAVLFRMKAGELSATPVETEVGFHLIKVDKRSDAAQLPFDAVKDWIKNYLVTQCWNRAFDQYIRLLAGRADIKGFSLAVEKTPLIQ
jgi:peptidyl-prolyl cis-trans isomerase C